MKKYFIFLISTFMLIMPGVTADESFTTYESMYQDYIPASSLVPSFSNPEFSHTSWESGYFYNNFTEFYKVNKNKTVFDNLYLELMDIFSYMRKDYPLYRLSVAIISTSSNEFKLQNVALTLRVYKDESSSTLSDVLEIANSYVLGTYYSPMIYYMHSTSTKTFTDEIYDTYNSVIPDVTWFSRNVPPNNNQFFYANYYYPFNSVPFKANENGTFYLPLNSFESSFDKYITNTTDVWKIYASDSSLLGTYEAGDVYPTFRAPGEVDLNYTLVNLNEYAYIGLSLKDYSKTDSFTTNTFVKGQSCVTPVYSFGTSLKTNGSSNICSPVYANFTQSSIYVLSSDIKNNVIYYVSAYDKSIENYIKVDTSLFNIHYITEENKDNPVFTINGEDHIGIGLDSIDYSANNNTTNGVVPGESENVADSFTDIMSKPFEFFKDIVSAIGSFFNLINSFISFLPTTLQSFLYFAFVVAIVLGIIKIIL